MLVYDELLAALGTVRSGVPGATVMQIWVDSPESLAAGRELWSIPKEMADFAGGDAIARLEARVGRRLLPGAPVPPPVVTVMMRA